MAHYDEQREQHEAERGSKKTAEASFHLANAVNELKAALALLPKDVAHFDLLEHVVELTKMVKELSES